MTYVPDGHGGLIEVTRPSPRSPAGSPTPTGNRSWACTTLRALIPGTSREFLPLKVTYGGQQVDDGITVHIAGRSHTLTVDGQATGVTVDHLPLGVHRVQARHDSGAVMDAGQVIVT